MNSRDFLCSSDTWQTRGWFPIIEIIYTYCDVRFRFQGHVNRSQFAKALADHGVRDKTRVQQYWNAMDTNKDNSIDWREFMTGLAILHKCKFSILSFSLHSCSLFCLQRNGEGKAETHV